MGSELITPRNGGYLHWLFYTGCCTYNTFFEFLVVSDGREESWEKHHDIPHNNVDRRYKSNISSETDFIRVSICA